MKTIRWGMIGCGDVAEIKSGPGFYKADHSRLVAVMRRNGQLAADYARRHDVSRWHDDAQRIIDDPDIDAVYIATLTDSHREYTLRCARAGKAVYVEKPMAMNHGECVEMIAACHAARVPLWVGYYRRALPRFLKVRTLIEDGAIGEVRLVVSRQLQRLPELSAGEVPWRVDPALSGGGFFFEAACHTLDFLDFLFGPIREVRASAGNQAGAWSPEDVVAATYHFQSGVFGSGIWCYTADTDEEMNEIVGAKGRIQFSTSMPVPIRLLRGDALETFAVPDPPHVHQPLIQTIVDELNGIGRCPSTGETAARTAWVMDQILAEFRAVPG
ncbi:MAG TPA: Gfo/Idh/MocA family oxidoreductase [Casimicrobiaceae bacterium]|jgi:1,5-anhydro-D-fructose reductase (1,5-anhydro-D-mannitol-forming)|nr:Gfo/Idh/MocA family oxidoreductase [Casimicrobiaceae bacterium]